MGQTVDSNDAEQYAAAVKANVEAAIHAAGFPGYFHQDVLSIDHLARIGAVLGTDVAGFLPPTPEPASQRSAQPTPDPRRARSTGGRGLLRRWASRPSANELASAY